MQWSIRIDPRCFLFLSLDYFIGAVPCSFHETRLLSREYAHFICLACPVL